MLEDMTKFFDEFDLKTKDEIISLALNNEKNLYIVF
jgi:hypothetical protein